MLRKPQYIRGIQCHKSLWLYKNKRNLLKPANAQTESLFATGKTVGDYAKQLFPDGVEIEFDANYFGGILTEMKIN